MFINFFDNLRRSGIPVSLREYLTFLEALNKNINTYEVESFYLLGRTIMVKDERHLDRFDKAFSHTFNCLDELSFRLFFLASRQVIQLYQLCPQKKVHLNR